MKQPNNQTLLALAGWTYVFGSGVLLILRKIPSDGLSWTLFVLFFLIALTASSSPGANRKDGIISPDDLIVKVNETVCTKGNGLLLIGPERPDGKMVAIIQARALGKKPLVPDKRPTPVPTGRNT